MSSQGRKVGEETFSSSHSEEEADGPDHVPGQVQDEVGGGHQNTDQRLLCKGVLEVAGCNNYFRINGALVKKYKKYILFLLLPFLLSLPIVLFPRPYFFIVVIIYLLFNFVEKVTHSLNTAYTLATCLPLATINPVIG